MLSRSLDKAVAIYNTFHFIWGEKIFVARKAILKNLQGLWSSLFSTGLFIIYSSLKR